MNVAILHNIIPPYRIPLFRALARDGRWHLRVLFMARSEPNRSWTVPTALDFDHVMLPGLHWALRRGEFTLHVNPAVLRELRRYRPDALVLGGYDSVTAYLAAFEHKTVRRRRLILWSESNLEGKSRTEGPKAFVKRFILGRLDHALVPGSPQEAYFRRLAGPTVPVDIFPNVVDPDRFHLDSDSRAKLRALGRRSLGVEGFVFLFCGRMIERKGFDLLLEAFRSCRARKPVTLVAVGDGTLAERARRLARELPAGRRIVVVPFRQIDELPALYAAADALVLPSRLEPWGLVVQEAMLAGIPVYASTAVGSAPDLVVEGETGRTYPVGDGAALRSALETASEDDVEEMGSRARDHARRYGSLDRCVEAFARAVGAR